MTGRDCIKRDGGGYIAIESWDIIDDNMGNVINGTNEEDYRINNDMCVSAQPDGIVRCTGNQFRQ